MATSASLQPEQAFGHWPPLVIDLTTAWSGPLCAAILADFGWTVVKIESARRPDVTRRLGPFADDLPGIERSGYFDTLNRGKRSVAIDLSTARGRGLARDLCLVADVVVENFSPGVMDRLGLAYASLQRDNPRLVMASISGYGQTGPESRYVAYGQTIEAAAGIDAITGYLDGPPMACGAPIADQVAGLTAAFHVQAAVQHQRRTGHGTQLDLSMLDALVALLPAELLDYQLTGQVQGPRANDDDRLAPHGVYPCRGADRWLAIAVATEQEWTGLCETLGRPEWRSDVRFTSAEQRHAQRRLLDALLATATADHEAGELAARLQAAGVPATEVKDGFALQSDPTLAARGFYVSVETSEAGQRVVPGAIARFAATPVQLRRGGPRLGAHTREVLTQLLQLDSATIDELVSSGVLA